MASTTTGRWDGEEPTSRLAHLQPDDARISIDDTSESTGLLGRGAGAYPNGNGAHATRSADDGWAGDGEFAGLPWWKRPSVCLGWQLCNNSFSWMKTRG
jgi:hypothetical protein